MAVRLNVVMNQTPPASAAAQRLSEGIVGEMIGRPGIDMVLVNTSSLEDASSTDLLTLQSITADFVYLDWKTPQEGVHWLARCHIEGTRFPHCGDPEAAKPASDAQPPARRIYFFDLNQYSQVGDVCNDVYGLLSLRQVRTYSLLPSSQSASSPVPNSPVPNSRSTNTSLGASLGASTTSAGNVADEAQARVLHDPTVPLDRQPVGRRASEEKPQHPSPPQEKKLTDRGDRPGLSNDQLDALVDELNAEELG